MSFSKALENFIIDVEGLELKRYADVAGLHTIGVGHLINHKGDRNLRMLGLDESVTEITEAQARELLQLDLEDHLAGIEDVLLALPMTHQREMFLSFAFNVGVGAAAGSTMARYIRDGKITKAAGEFQRWHRAGGRKIKGLLIRRMMEAGIFAFTVPSEDEIQETMRRQIPSKAPLVGADVWRIQAAVKKYMTDLEKGE